jgi:16S rRNA (uracil1498-N3)-methyltransferase
MNRIFLPQNILREKKSLTGDLHKQVSVVLRTRPGEKFRVVSGDGYEYTVEIEKITHKETTFRIIDKTEKNVEPSISLHLYLGVLKGSAMEEILPSLVFLGVSSVTPLITERSLAREKDFPPVKNERIEKIISRALALSGRTGMMDWHSPVHIRKALEAGGSYEHSFFFWEEAEYQPLKTHFSGIKHGDSIGIFIGPEGGFTQEEAEWAKQQKLAIASLGPRILDAKTAPITAVSSILYETENI